MPTTRQAKRFDPRRIRDARAMTGLTHDQFGRALKKTGRTVRNWEQGLTSPTIRDLEALCQHYGFDLSYFVNGQQVS